MKTPLKAEKPHDSNGYTYVYDANRIEVSTCYGKDALKVATEIADIVNQHNALTAVAAAALAMGDMRITESVRQPNGEYTIETTEEFNLKMAALMAANRAFLAVVKEVA